MGYVAGETILDDEFNAFVASSSDPFGFNHFAGTGATVYGLGQAAIPTVAGGTTSVAAAQWNSLLAGLDNIANHTNDTMTARTAVTAGDTIAIKSAVAADLATLAASVAGGSVNATAIATSSALQTVTTAACPTEGKMPKAKAKAKTKAKTKVRARMTKAKAKATRERGKALTENKPSTSRRTQTPRPSHLSTRGCSFSTTTPWVWRSHLPPQKDSATNLRVGGPAPALDLSSPFLRPSTFGLCFRPTSE